MVGLETEQPSLQLWRRAFAQADCPLGAAAVGGCVPPILVGVSAAEEFVHRLSTELVKTLGGDLLSLGLHGSYATGDFTVGRSDVDLLAVVAEDPEPATLDRLFEMHSRLDKDFPEWSGHVEVEYVSAQAVQDVVDSAETRHPMIRISPGEALHRVDATRHYLLNWAAAIEANRPVARAAPAELLPAIDWELVRRVILDHVRTWPQWVQEITMTPGGQAYSVLTLCRSAAALATGHQVSKRQGATAGRRLFPEWSDLIAWACSWWYEGGADTEPRKRDEVMRFVNEVSRRLLIEHDQRSHNASSSGASVRTRPHRSPSRDLRSLYFAAAERL